MKGYDEEYDSKSPHMLYYSYNIQKNEAIK